MRAIPYFLVLLLMMLGVGCGEEEAPGNGGADGDGGASTNPPPPKVTLNDIRKEADAAIKGCDTNELSRLVKEHPDLANHVNKKSSPMVHTAVKSGCIDAVKILVDNKADLTKTDYSGCFPIHCAAGWATLEMLEYVVSIGGDINQVTEKGRTVMSFAENNFYDSSTSERRKIVQFLTDKKYESKKKL